MWFYGIMIKIKSEVMCVKLTHMDAIYKLYDTVESCHSMAVGAHPDDCEIIGIKGINDKGFFAVVTTHGAIDQPLIQMRQNEQACAAKLGHYLGYAMLGYDSNVVKRLYRPLIDDYKKLMLTLRPEVIYTHSLFDKHDTHVGVVYHLIHALLELKDSYMPKRVLGCEVWRDLDWLKDSDKIVLDTSETMVLQEQLLQCFTSQTKMKRYDKAVIARQIGHAVFQDAYQANAVQGVLIATDLMPLLMQPAMTIESYVNETLNRFNKTVLEKINRYGV